MNKRSLLITGANGGLGTALVNLFLDRSDFTVLCHVRNNDREIYKILEQHGKTGEKIIYKANLVNENEV